jgi:methyl-accepting chemotaxis protein
MEELAGTVRQNTDSARQARDLAAQAATAARESSRSVIAVLATMQQIEASSHQIGDIVSLIDGIAFQTNILALNAAVEAARAGEQGRGFAVVAGEVRSLAQRAAGAAKEVKHLIDTSSEHVQKGGRLADQAGQSMGETEGKITSLAERIQSIAAASEEQIQGIERVNGAIVQLDGVTQQNAELVERAAAASESLVGQARNLVEAVSVFKIAAAVAVGENAARSASETDIVSPSPLRRPDSARSPRKAPSLTTPELHREPEWETF